MKDVLPTRKSRNQHDERTLGKVEIGDKGIDEMELKARIDKNLGPVAAGHHGAACSRRFQGADTRRADGNDAPALFLGPVQAAAASGETV